MTGERSAEIADQFAAANAAVIAFARSCSEDQWRAVVPEEGWTVGVVVHHIAEGHANGARWLAAMIEGGGVTETVGDIDAVNEGHARDFADVSVADTVALLEENGARTEALLRQLSDADLARSAPFGPANGQVLPVSAFAPVTAGHALVHLAHAHEAVAGLV